MNNARRRIQEFFSLNYYKLVPGCDVRLAEFFCLRLAIQSGLMKSNDKVWKRICLVIMARPNLLKDISVLRLDYRHLRTLAVRIASFNAVLLHTLQVTDNLT